jgi:hypothetical protein
MIKNYTSSVSVERSLELIERELVRAGAKHVARSYDDDQHVCGMLFQLEVDGNPQTFKVPANVQNVFTLMWQEVRRPRPSTKLFIAQQAARTAWKLLYDWVTVQVALIKVGQVEPMEVFMPYLYDGKRNKTLFQISKEFGYTKLLTQGKDDKS